jgi:hypothetical protein
MKETKETVGEKREREREREVVSASEVFRVFLHCFVLFFFDELRSEEEICRRFQFWCGHL